MRDREKDDDLMTFGLVVDEEEAMRMAALEPLTPIGSGESQPGRPHQEPSSPAWQQPATPPDNIGRRHQRSQHIFEKGLTVDQGQDQDQDPDPDTDTDTDTDTDFVNVPSSQHLEASKNGNLVTRKEVQAQIVKVAKEGGKLTYLVAQATAEWWKSPEMTKRKRAATRRILDAGGAVATGAGNMLIHNTPLGRVTVNVSNNVNAFKASPFHYSMQGLGIMKKTANDPTASTEESQAKIGPPSEVKRTASPTSSTETHQAHISPRSEVKKTEIQSTTPIDDDDSYDFLLDPDADDDDKDDEEDMLACFNMNDGDDDGF